MKKILILVLSMILLAITSYGQESNVNVTADTKAKCCASMKECAKKMGMTEAECKKVCSSKMSDASAKVASSTASADIIHASASTSEKKTCNKSLEQCAKEMGMSVAECKKICTDAKVAATNSDEKTKVASALSTSEAVLVENKSESKKCCSSKKSCKK